MKNPLLYVWRGVDNEVALFTSRKKASVGSAGLSLRVLCYKSWVKYNGVKLREGEVVWYGFRRR